MWLLFAWKDAPSGGALDCRGVVSDFDEASRIMRAQGYTDGHIATVFPAYETASGQGQPRVLVTANWTEIDGAPGWYQSSVSQFWPADGSGPFDILPGGAKA